MDSLTLRRLRKVLTAMITPSKWKSVREQSYLYATNIIRYGNLSFNLNSRKFWNDELSKFDTFWRNENYSHILDLLPRDKAFTLLDIGCAIGDGCELLKERFPEAEITGVDISEVGIEKARRKTKGVHYFVFDVLKDPIPKKYDYIVILETLEHFNDPFFVVDKCLRHVNEAFIVSVPYTPEYSGKRIVVGEHRYCFNESTFVNYDCRVVRISEHGKDEKETVIIYEFMRHPS